MKNQDLSHAEQKESASLDYKDVPSALFAFGTWSSYVRFSF